MKRLIIIPTYNESQNIEQLIRGIRSLSTSFDILTVDDNSPDGTAALVDRLAKNDGTIHVMTRVSKQGLGTAYQDGFRWAIRNGYDRVFTMDADHSHNPEYLTEIDRLLDNSQLAIGSRYVKNGGVRGWPLGRRLLSSFGNYYARLITGIPVKDCTAGFIGMRRELVEHLLGEQIKSEGYSFHIELKYMAWKQGYTLAEYPILFMDRESGRSKISRRIILEAFCLVWKLRFGKTGGSDRGNAVFKLIDRYIGIPLVWLAGKCARGGKKHNGEIRKILIIKLSAMGDTVLLVPALRALRKAYPKAEITALATSINSQIFKACPYVDNVMMLDIKKMLYAPTGQIKLLRKSGYDIALDFDQWLRISPLLAFASGAGIRIGFNTKGQMRHFAYTESIEHKRDRHEVRCFLDILGPLGITAVDESLQFWISSEMADNAAKTLENIGIGRGEKFVVFHPETPAHGVQRQWPEEKYIELGRKFGEKHKTKILVTGTKQDAASNARIAAALSPFGIMLPPMSLMEYAAILKNAELLVCGNTGIMHLACALGISVVALHGPTDPVKWGPWGDRCRVIKSKMKCSPCLYLGFEYGCATNQCMESISPDDVFAVVDEIVAKSGEK